MPYEYDYNYSGNLEFSHCVLNVRIEEIRIERDFPSIYDYDSSGYYSSSRSTIRGRFSVDTVGNNIADIQECLGNPFDKKPHLTFAEKRYEIMITGISWGSLHSYGNSYRCDFVATPVEEKKETNTLIWDATNITNDFTLNDIKDLVGEEDLLKLEKSVINLIEKHTSFRPTKDNPTPSSYDECTHADDLAAVLSGSKPAVMFDESELNDPIIALMCAEACVRGYKIGTVENFGHIRSIVVGDSYNVREIIEIVDKAVKDNAVSEYYYWRLGMLLGYPDDALNKFVKNVKDFGFNRKL